MNLTAMTKKTTILCLLLLLAASVANAAVIDRVVAIVNDGIITSYQLDQRLATTKGAKDNPASRRQMLEVMIDELLMRQRAEEIGIQIGEADVDKAVADVARKNGISVEDLQKALKAQGLTLEQYREQLRGQILNYKLLGHEVQSKVDITRKEIRDYYQQHLDEYRRSASVTLARISCPVNGDRDAAMKIAKQARRRLLAGESVDDVLLALSTYATVDGGDMGNFAPGELSGPFAAAIADLDSGGVSAVIDSGDTLHVLKVEQRTSAGVVDLSQVEEEIRTLLRKQKLEKRMKKWRKKLRDGAYIDVRL